MKKPQNFTNYLDKLVQSYNNSFHTAIKAKPSSVNKNNEDKIRKQLYSQEDIFIKFNYKIGDYVRISQEKKLFEKGYTPNWSEDIYIISNLIPTEPPRYILKDLENNIYTYKFYSEELQKVLYEEFPYDAFEVINESSQNILIEKINSNQKSKWVDKSNFLK